MKALLACPILFAALVTLGASARAARPMTVDDLLAMHRVSDPQLSPDGRWIAYVVGVVDVPGNRTDSDIWVALADGSGTPRQLTASPKQDRHPRWSPDGQWILFESNRGGDFQLYTMPVSGGEARPLTRVATEASQGIWSPDGRHVAFVSAVFPQFSSKPFPESDAANREEQRRRDESKVKARVIDQLMYRHWDAWVDGKRQHLFVLPIRDGVAQGDPRDVTPGDQDAVPTSSTFSAGDEFAFTADGRHLLHTATPTPTREEAWSTNHDIWSVDVASGERSRITSNLAADGLPRPSPDGRFMAYRAQARPGFEADRWQLMVREQATGTTRSLTRDFDTSVEGLAWTPDGTGLVIEAEDRGTKRLWRVGLEGGAPQPLTTGGSAGEATVAGGRIAFTASSLSHPPDVRAVPLAGGLPTLVSKANEGRLRELMLPEPESVSFEGGGGTSVQMWILKPPGFDASRKWPLVFWVHGGPQGAFMDAWSVRWNAQAWAARGWVIALPNPRGSTGFGQRFTDEISRDWGGKVFDDLMAGLAWLERQPWIDASRMASAGASYGGYMMNWFQGHTDKFKALVTHCGVYEFATMYGTTEELWFDEWEHGIPWQDPDFEKWSPHRHAAKFKTPNLVIHGELDFRVPVHQGLSLFTTLQRKGVPSRLLYFPDEGHWVLKPQNSALWHRTVFDWLNQYLR